MWRCAVWSKTYGWDIYLVLADDIKQARAECLERLQEETDDPESWKIKTIIRLDYDNNRVRLIKNSQNVN